MKCLVCDLSTGKVVVNGIEITSIEDWKKVINSLVDLQQENKQLNQLLKDKGFIIDKLMEENRQLKESRDKAIEYIEYNNETLYTYEPDYDYEENIVSNYDVSSFREDLLEILKGSDKE